jgi:hypothetical protein
VPKRYLLTYVLSFLLFHQGLIHFLDVASNWNFFKTVSNGNGVWQFALDKEHYLRILESASNTLISPIDASYKYSSNAFERALFFLGTQLPAVDLLYKALLSISWLANFFIFYWFLLNNRLTGISALLGATLFSLVPSYLIYSTQTPKDSFFITSICLVLYYFSRPHVYSAKDWLISTTYLCTALILSYTTRAYFFEYLVISVVIAISFSALFRRNSAFVMRISSVLVSVFVVGALSSTSLSSSANLDENAIGGSVEVGVSSSSPSSSPLQALINKFQRHREGFATSGGDSNFFTHITFSDPFELLSATPQILYITFFEPDIGRLGYRSRTGGALATVISIIQQTAFLICLSYIILNFKSASKQYGEVLIFSIFLMAFTVILATMVTNLGTFFRLRYPFQVGVYWLAYCHFYSKRTRC